MSDILERLPYWRKRYAQELRVRRQYAMPTFDGCSEYEFMKRGPVRKTLHCLAQREADLRCVAAYRDLLSA